VQPQPDTAELYNFEDSSGSPYLLTEAEMREQYNPDRQQIEVGPFNTHVTIVFDDTVAEADLRTPSPIALWPADFKAVEKLREVQSR
jgi:hypothetical protein